ncbi:hypothetical protein FF1_038204 [Malus domestica]
MGSEGSHNTQNDTPSHLAKVDELEAQNNKIAMKNEILQEQYEKVFEMLHEARYTKTHKLITPVEVNHQLGASQHGGSFTLNIAASTRSKRSGGRYLLTKGVEGSKAVFRDCRDFLKQRRDNLIHVSLKINDPRVSKRLGPLLCLRLATNLGKGKQVLEEHEGIGDSEMFRQTYLGSQILLSYIFLRKPDPLTRRILDTPSKQRQSRSLACNSILEMRTRLNTLTSLSPPWHTGCTPTKSDVFFPLHPFWQSSKMTDRLHFADDLYNIRQKPDESLGMYSGRFRYEYSRCAEADDKIALKAFTAGLRDCFFKYMINANT